MDLNGCYRSSSDDDSCDHYGYAKWRRKNNKDTETMKKKNTVYNMQYDRYKVFESQDMEKGQFDLVLEIEEKMLYVHKFYLITASGTLGAMLSDRWNKTPNEAIKIENYSFDDFYEFMCFIYCGTCALTNENIMALVDMAEFYGVPLLKDYCDSFLSKTNNYVNNKNLEKMVELAERYSLTKFTVALQRYIRLKVDAFVYDKNFINFEKSFVKFLAGVKRFEHVESDFFEAVFKWAENQALIKEKMSKDENFNLQDAIKEELIDFLPKIKFYAMSVVFIATNIIRDKPYLFSTSECYKILRDSIRHGQDNVFFRAVYELAEKELTEKQKVSASDNFNFEDAIKFELAEIFPFINFNNMPLDFIISFIFPDKTFLFSTSQLYDMLITSRRYLQEEDFFKAIYGLAEKEALEKQKGSSDDDFDVESTIKSALVDILIKFILDKQFLFDYPQMSQFFAAVEQPQRDESSRDVKTARSPAPAEHPSYAAVTGVAPSTATVATTDDNNNVQLVKDSDGDADPVSKSPTAKTAIIPTESERFRGELGNLPDSTARNSSPNPGASNLEVKPDPATASALSEKKKVKKRSSGACPPAPPPKKSKVSTKSNEIKSSDGGASD